MNIDPKYLEMSFEAVGVRNSQKRLKSLIAEQAVEPLNQFQDELINKFDLVAEIMMKRIATTIAFWAQHKHEPTAPHMDNLMSEITNSTKNDVTLKEFYASEVKAALYTLAPMFGLEMQDDYVVPTDELEFALLELEEKFEDEAIYDGDGYDYDDYDDDEYQPETAAVDNYADYYEVDEEQAMPVQQPVREGVNGANGTRRREPVRERAHEARERAIVSSPRPVDQVIEVAETGNIVNSTLNISVEQAWGLIYGLIGYPSEYVQQTMLPRWQEYPNTFDKDRRFLYGLFIDTLRNAAGLQHIAGNFRFADRDMTIDQLWTHYFADLSKNIAPQLAAAKLHTAANDPWHKKLRQNITSELGNISLIWLIALGIALIFDGLTTFISLDQTPMDGMLVLVFTFLITALFQIADQLVISYRKREFEAEAMSAKYHAQFERLSKAVSELDATSESYVQLSMNKSKANADWKATEDNRRMARRGRFWSARIADINVVVTAYGFAFMFLNSTEPMQAIFEQIEIVLAQDWANLDIWVFLMVGLAVTVSFVVNTAQRTEILGWSMRRLKNE